MTWVKICGMTNLEDALMAVDAGADAVGFVFYEKSPRCVTVERAREIVEKLPKSVEKVGVFVEQTCGEIGEIASHAKLTAVQLHGSRSAEAYFLESRAAVDCVGVGKVIEVVPAKRLADGTGVSVRKKDRYFAVMVDHVAEGAPGGSGQKFDWDENLVMIRGLGLMIPVVVAGGLNALNVAAAMRVLEPWGVDVASGVEAQPGKKDPDKVRAFVRAVREWDGKVS
jgi:phosphoribosylanthranilate isomerase